MVNPFPPLWSPRFQYDEETGELQYKPFPRYPHWLVAWTVPGGGGGGTAVYPQWAERFHDAAYFVTGAPGKFLLPDDQPYGYAMCQSNDGDEWQHGVLLAAADTIGYYVEILGFNSPSGGIMDLYIDDQLIQQFDYYSPTSDYNTTWQVALLPEWTPENKVYMLRGVTNGKNASSSGYENWITKISIRPYFEGV